MEDYQSSNIQVRGEERRVCEGAVKMNFEDRTSGQEGRPARDDNDELWPAIKWEWSSGT